YRFRERGSSGGVPVGASCTCQPVPVRAGFCRSGKGDQGGQGDQCQAMTLFRARPRTGLPRRDRVPRGPSPTPPHPRPPSLCPRHRVIAWLAAAPTDGRKGRKEGAARLASTRIDFFGCLTRLGTVTLVVG